MGGTQADGLNLLYDTVVGLRVSTVLCLVLKSPRNCRFSLIITIGEVVVRRTSALEVKYVAYIKVHTKNTRDPSLDGTLYLFAMLIRILFGSKNVIHG